jgi:hypothetical protein
MFYSENAACVPNFINQTFEEQEVLNRARVNRPFKEVSNLISKRPSDLSVKEQNR